MRSLRTNGCILGVHVFLIAFLIAGSLSAQTKVRIVATSTAFGEIAKEIGGERVEVKTLAHPTQDIHFLEPKPSDILSLSRADLFIHAGLDLELWRGPLVEAASNLKVFPGTPGDFDASHGVNLLEVPTRQLTRAEGDIHIFGNPHYWLDPINGKLIASHLRDRLASLSPGAQNTFDGNLARFTKTIDEKMKGWQKKMEPFTGAKIVFYHKSWVYLTERFRLKTIDYLEPKPNIAPSGAHLSRVIAKMKEEGVKVIVIEPFHPRGSAVTVAKETGAEMLVLGTHPGWTKGTEGYAGLFDYLVDQLARVFEKTRLAKTGEQGP